MLTATKVLLGLFVGVPVTTIFTVASTLLYCQIRNFIRYKVTGCTVPAIPERPFIGSFTIEEPHQHALKSHAKYGPVFYWTMITLPCIATADPEIAQMVFAKVNFPKSVLYRGVADFAGESLVTMPHEEWKVHRDLVNPAFKVSNLRAMRQLFAQHAVRFCEMMVKHADTKPDVSLEFLTEIGKLALDVISSAGFNHDLGAFGNIGSDNPVLRGLQAVVANLLNPLVLVPYGGSHILPYLYRDKIAVIDKLFYGVIDKRIKEHETGKKDPSRIPDILDLMMEPGENGTQLSRTELRNELLIFYLAGYETTATTLSWTIYEMIKNPDVYQKLVDELDSVIEPSAEIICPSPDQLDELRYMTMVLNESLRKYPPTVDISREIPETFEHSGYVFPKGYCIQVSMLGIQRNEKYWSNPSKYDPERFTKENSEGRHPYAFIPFAGGPRICIGKNFFYHEAKAVLATLLRHVKFELDPTKESGREVSPSALMKPNAVWVKVSRRTR